MIDPVSIAALFRALSDPMRVRILHLLQREELTVGELVRILSVPQSTVSRHLKALREVQLVTDRALGPATFYQSTLDSHLADQAPEIRESLAAYLRTGALTVNDAQGLERVLAMRGEEGDAFFDRIGLRWDSMRESAFGPSFHLEAFLSLLPSEWTVADLGTGTGYLLPVLGRQFRHVFAVDNSKPMLELARRRSEEAGVLDCLEFVEGDLENLPLAESHVDLAIAVLMLHHLVDIRQALAEVRRILRPHGRFLIVDLMPYQNSTFQARMSDRHPGIDPDQLQYWLREAGFDPAVARDVPASPRSDNDLGTVPQLYVMAARAARRTAPVAAAAGKKFGPELDHVTNTK